MCDYATVILDLASALTRAVDLLEGVLPQEDDE